MFDFSNLARITTLALADSVNPCEIAVLTMVLMSILIQNPDKRKKVLYAGLAFVSSVFIGYIFYGVVLVQFFKTATEFLRQNSIFIYDVLAVFAMILGALNIKDFFYYKAGSVGTEMPLFLRPKVKRIINQITSAKGAFIIGFLVTIFLLPCTIGPYIVASGILSSMSVLQSSLWLVYYNILFVLPMLAITLIVYLGFAQIDEVSGWKEKNIKRLHLIAGILLFLMGLALLMGWI